MRKVYYLDLVPESSKQLTEAYTADISDQPNTSGIWLWHKWLGHASFGYLKKLFPKLFSHVSTLDLKCDVCELTKSHHVSFSPSMNKSCALFMIIHSDV